MIEIIILSVVQGITEFIPVSSTLHLLIFSKFLNDYQINLLILSSMHLGSLLAVSLFFLIDSKLEINKISYLRLMQFIFVGTLPIFVAGFFFYDFVDRNMSINFLVITSTFLFGILLFVSDKYSENKKDFNNLNFFDLFLIGIFQCFALIPGTSRSAATIIPSRFLKINRETSIIISALLSFPTIVGAFVYSLFVNMDVNNINYSIITQDIFLSILFSFIASYFGLKLFYKYSSLKGFGAFAAYRILLAIFLIFN
mgnify:FL=1|jgi:undecaprenyl-diphosphatase